MEDIDTQSVNEPDDHQLLLRHVIGDEHDLLFLDSYLTESLRGDSPRGRFVVDPAEEGETL